MRTASKADLIDEVAATTGLSKRAVGDVLDAALAAIRTTAEAGTPVRLNGFGRFEMRERAARNGRNPATGEVIQIAASSHLAFRASKA